MLSQTITILVTQQATHFYCEMLRVTELTFYRKLSCVEASQATEIVCAWSHPRANRHKCTDPEGTHGLGQELGQPLPGGFSPVIPCSAGA